jgi:hypothetical protein
MLKLCVLLTIDLFKFIYFTKIGHYFLILLIVKVYNSKKAYISMLILQPYSC